MRFIDGKVVGVALFGLLGLIVAARSADGVENTDTSILLSGCDSSCYHGVKDMMDEHCSDVSCPCTDVSRGFAWMKDDVTEKTYLIIVSNSQGCSHCSWTAWTKFWVCCKDPDTCAGFVLNSHSTTIGSQTPTASEIKSYFYDVIVDHEALGHDVYAVAEVEDINDNAECGSGCLYLTPAIPGEMEEYGAP